MNQTEALLEERGRTHGDYEDFASVVQGMKTIIRMYQRENFRVLSAPHQDAIDMILHKIGRIVSGDPNVKDHWDDIAGYATLGGKYVRPRIESTPQTETPKPSREILNVPLIQAACTAKAQEEIVFANLQTVPKGNP